MSRSARTLFRQIFLVELALHQFWPIRPLRNQPARSLAGSRGGKDAPTVFGRILPPETHRHCRLTIFTTRIRSPRIHVALSRRPFRQRQFSPNHREPIPAAQMPADSGKANLGRTLARPSDHFKSAPKSYGAFSRRRIPPANSRSAYLFANLSCVREVARHNLEIGVLQPCQNVRPPADCSLDVGHETVPAHDEITRVERGRGW